MGVYNRAPLAFDRGRGARLFSTDGDEYLDCVAGIATDGLGHAHPALVEALHHTNASLWEVEDQLRDHERQQDFGATFVALARSVYRLNDERASLKKRINLEAGSQLVEEKSYAAY